MARADGKAVVLIETDADGSITRHDAIWRSLVAFHFAHELLAASVEEPAG